MSTILILDDDQATIDMLIDGFSNMRYDAFGTTSPREAISLGRKLQPDVMLLGVTVHGISGFAIYEQIKTIPSLIEMPVIFLAEWDNIHEKQISFQVGGVDYLSRPICFEEVESRICLHLKLRDQRIEIEKLQRSNSIHQIEREILRSRSKKLHNDFKNQTASLNVMLHLIKRYAGTSDTRIEDCVLRAQNTANRMFETNESITEQCSSNSLKADYQWLVVVPILDRLLLSYQSRAKIKSLDFQFNMVNVPVGTAIWTETSQFTELLEYQLGLVIQKATPNASVDVIVRIERETLGIFISLFNAGIQEDGQKFTFPCIQGRLKHDESELVELLPAFGTAV